MTSKRSESSARKKRRKNWAYGSKEGKKGRREERNSKIMPQQVVRL